VWCLVWGRESIVHCGAFRPTMKTHFFIKKMSRFRLRQQDKEISYASAIPRKSGLSEAVSQH